MTRARRVGAQGGDPAEALAGGQVLADALAGEHAAVAHEHDGGEAAGGDMAGGPGLEDLEGVGGGADNDAALEEEGDLVDERGGELGDVREGGLEDLAAVTAGLADEDGGRGVAVRDALNIQYMGEYRRNQPIHAQ